MPGEEEIDLPLDISAPPSSLFNLSTASPTNAPSQSSVLTNSEEWAAQLRALTFFALVLATAVFIIRIKRHGSDQVSDAEYKEQTQDEADRVLSDSHVLHMERL